MAVILPPENINKTTNNVNHTFLTTLTESMGRTWSWIKSTQGQKSLLLAGGTIVGVLGVSYGIYHFSNDLFGSKPQDDLSQKLQNDKLSEKPQKIEPISSKPLTDKPIQDDIELAKPVIKPKEQPLPEAKAKPSVENETIESLIYRNERGFPSIKMTIFPNNTVEYKKVVFDPIVKPCEESTSDDTCQSPLDYFREKQKNDESLLNLQDFSYKINVCKKELSAFEQRLIDHEIKEALKEIPSLMKGKSEEEIALATSNARSALRIWNREVGPTWSKSFAYSKDFYEAVIKLDFSRALDGNGLTWDNLKSKYKGNFTAITEASTRGNKLVDNLVLGKKLNHSVKTNKKLEDFVQNSKYAGYISDKTVTKDGKDWLININPHLKQSFSEIEKLERPVWTVDGFKEFGAPYALLNLNDYKGTLPFKNGFVGLGVLTSQQDLLSPYNNGILLFRVENDQISIWSYGKTNNGIESPSLAQKGVSTARDISFTLFKITDKKLEHAQKLAKEESPDFNFFTNNCKHFAQKILRELKLPSCDQSTIAFELGTCLTQGSKRDTISVDYKMFYRNEEVEAMKIFDLNKVGHQA